jgi:hypothetical protein
LEDLVVNGRILNGCQASRLKVVEWINFV